jgi:RNAse (barnase) inhibitor barstar
MNRQTRQREELGRDLLDWSSPVRRGVLHEERRLQLQAQARALDWDYVEVDLVGCEEKNDLLAEIATALDFPVWFGSNWDALFDCLADLNWRPAPGHLVALRNLEDLQEVSPEVLDTLISILEDVATVWERRGQPLRVWVDLPPDEAAARRQ